MSQDRYASLSLSLSLSLVPYHKQKLLELIEAVLEVLALDFNQTCGTISV